MSLTVKSVSEEDAWREMAYRNRMRAENAENERDKWIRLFNRLDAAISHHKRDNEFADLEDDALWAARERILKDATA